MQIATVPAVCEVSTKLAGFTAAKVRHLRNPHRFVLAVAGGEGAGFGDGQGAAEIIALDLGAAERLDQV